MNGLCPNCEKETIVELIKEKESFDVRGEKITVDVEFFKCNECSEEFESTRGYDALELAYQAYRTLKSMLQPEEIREWRKSKGLTQKELSDLLGLGGATLSRYENGALQVDTHEKVLRLAMDPHNLLKLIEDSPDALAKDKRDKLISDLRQTEKEACNFESLIEMSLGNYDPDINSGYQIFNLTKLFNVILFFCKDKPLKTKLNKLLFYADFKHFKEYTVSITGARYFHLQYGPVPDKYDFFTAELLREERLEAVEVMFKEYSGTSYFSLTDSKVSIFSDTELKILTEVNLYFKDFNSRAIKDFSHKESAYSSTNSGDMISYQYAEDLQL